jgi:hypothetical protein
VSLLHDTQVPSQNAIAVGKNTLGSYRLALSELVRHRYILDEDRGALLQLGEWEWDLQPSEARSSPATINRSGSSGLAYIRPSYC